MVGRGAMPVLKTVGGEVHVPWAKFDEILALVLHEPPPVGDIQRLTAHVRVPCRTCARREVHVGDAQLGVRVRLHDLIEPHIAGEELLRALDRGWLWLQSHFPSQTPTIPAPLFRL